MTMILWRSNFYNTKSHSNKATIKFYLFTIKFFKCYYHIIILKWLSVVKLKLNNSPSLLMPTAMHFFNRQYWHLFLLMRRMAHCWFLVQGRYWIFCWMERRKNPCGSQLHLESRSASDSSLEQPESLDSRRASSMLTSTEWRSRSSAHDMLTTHAHSRMGQHNSAPIRATVDEGLRRRRAARPQLAERPSCRPPTRPRKWECPGPRRPQPPASAPNGPRRSRMRHCTGAPPRWI